MARERLTMDEVRKINEELMAPDEDQGHKMLGVALIVLIALVIVLATWMIGRAYERRAIRAEILAKMGTGKVETVILKTVDLFIAPQCPMMVEKR